MKLEKWALIAEVVSAAAILVTLITLVLEVRTNTNVSRIAAYQAVTRDFDDFRSMVLSDPELLEIFAQLVVSGQYPDLSGGDPLARARLFLMIDNQFSGNERAYIAYRDGIIGDQEWPRISRALCAEFADLPQSMRDRTLFRLTDDFGDYLQTECEP